MMPLFDTSFIGYLHQNMSKKVEVLNDKTDMPYG